MLTCKKMGQAKNCGSCKNAPINQLGKQAGQPLNASVNSKGHCLHYVQVVTYRQAKK